jgi:HSP20 family protein
MRFEHEQKEQTMANITRFDPFGELMTRFDPFGDWFEDFPRLFSRPMRLPEGEQPVRIKVDVAEDDKAYTVRADIPGVKKEDIKVSVDGNQISISAEVKKEREEKEGEKLLRSERYEGNAYRSFTLPQDVNEGAVQAKYADGVLSLTLPKKPGGKARQIAVQ